MWRCLFLLVLTAGQFGETNTGELRLTVTDQAGLPVQGAVQLISESNQVRQNLETDPRGTLVAKRLPFGRYRVEVSRAGFATFAGLLDLQTALPTEYHVTLVIASVRTQVSVGPDATLVDPHRTGAVNRIGSDTLQSRISALPGRSLPDVVNTQPGWLLEANGILHPRGSEYQVQYVVDGLPITDNRSPSFAPGMEPDDVHTMNILTGGYPAEYGRKLGGVIEVVTSGDVRKGFHGGIVASGGSFGTANGYAMGEYGWGRNTVSVSGNLAHTDRYLDPPVEENFTNSGTGSNVAAHFEREITDADRLGVIVRHGQTSFLVPNERVQQDAGQRQERKSEETVGQFSYQHIFSANLLGDVRGLVRDLSAGLTSNPLSTPILAGQDRGFRELYLKGTVTAHAGRHEWKAGVDADFGSVRESFNYQITDPGQFDPETAQVFDFADRRHDREQALFLQDQVQLGAWTINAGVRWDHYRLVVDEGAVSPRLGVAWSRPAAGIVVRASYDRAFQTPAVENLLLASSSAVDALDDEVARLPVRPSRGHFYEAGFSKSLFGKARLDVSYFRRDMRDFADDDVLLNTGVSFPMAFRKARISGTEVKLELPHWRAISGFVSYGNMLGVGDLPITGGLLLGDEAADALSSTDRFPISQDQRNTMRSRVTYQVSPRAWVALAASYGSGLPVEFEGDPDQAVAQYGQRILDRVDLERGRTLPVASLDASASVTIVKSGKRTVRLQADGLNLTNRLNVINFAGLFSGTALAPPRSVAVRLHAEF
jgi:TonB dependent receptor-like, beta-barrel/Carboxypeptidase regulatory-like domain